VFEARINDVTNNHELHHLTMCLHCLQKAAAAADPIVEGCRAVLYADFLRPGGPEAARYEEVTDTSKLLQAVEEALGEYNAQVGVQGS
jgi:hypothetical protein